nr:retrovirus-related Pol polyprotein from transposon TNT 1-94 [Tanacetum cinerariifolium]
MARGSSRCGGAPLKYVLISRDLLLRRLKSEWITGNLFLNYFLFALSLHHWERLIFPVLWFPNDHRWKRTPRHIDRQIQNVGGNGGNQFGLYAGQVAKNQQGYNAWQNGGIQGAQNAGQNAGVQNGRNHNGLVVVRGIANQSGTGNVVAARAEGTGIGNQARIQLQVEEFDFMAAAGDLDEIEEVNANCILMANLQQASTSGTQHDKALVYDTDDSGENDNHVTSVAPSVVQSERTVETSSALNEETRAHQETVYPKFVRDFKSLAKEVDEFLDKQKSLELEIERLLNASVSHDIMSIVQNGFVDVPSDLRTELDRTKEKLELCIIKKEKEYAVLWNNWYTKCEECKYDKISYGKAYNDMQQKVERLQAQLRDLKGKSSYTPSASNTLDPLNQKLESKIVELEFQVVNYEREISHFKTTYKNLFDSNKSNRVHAKLYDLIYENAQLRAQGFENTSESKKNTSGTSVTPHVDKPKLSVVTSLSKKLHASMPSHSVPQPREFNVVKHRNVIAPGMFKINPSQTLRVDLVPNKQSSASIRTNPITNSQRHVFVKENVSSNMVTASSTGLVHTARTRRPQPKDKSRNARVPSASKSSKVKKNVTVEEHRMTLLLPKNQETMSSECNNIKLAIQNDKSKIFFANCKQCLVTANPDACFLSSVVQICLWCVDSGCSKHMTRNIKLLINFVWKFLGTVRFGNDHIAATLGYGDLKWGNITIIWVYFVEGLGHNLFLVGQFYDADLEVAFRRNTCFVRDLDGVDLLKGNRSTNLYTINHYDMASASPICLMARATPTKSWLWHQCLSHLNFDTINDLAKNDLVFGLPKFKYAKENLCPSCEQGKSKRASHPPKPVLNSQQWLHLLHMDLCGPMRVTSINAVPRTIPTAPVVQNLQASTTSMSFQDSAPVPTNSSNTPVFSNNVNATSQQHAQQQRNLTPSPTTSAADNVPNVVFEGDLFVNPFGTLPLKEILTEYHTTLKEPVLTRTKPYLDDRHVLDGLDQQSPPAD